MSDWKYIRTLSQQSIYDIALREYGDIDKGVSWLLADNPNIDLQTPITSNLQVRIRKNPDLSREAREIIAAYDRENIEIATSQETNPTPPGGGGGGGTVCLPAKIYYSDGSTLVATVQPNGYLNIPKHSILFDDGSVAAEQEFDENYTMPNVIVKDSQNNTIMELQPGSLLQWFPWILKDEDGNQIDTGLVTNSNNQDVIAPNGDVKINGALVAEVLSNGEIDLPVVEDGGFTATGSWNAVEERFEVPKAYQILKLKVLYASGDTNFSITITADEAGTINSIDSAGLTNFSLEKNSSAVSTPFTIADGDVLEGSFDAAGSDGEVILEGVYT